jgi:hypothetical protein
MAHAVVDERGDDRGELLAWLAPRLGGLGQGRAELVEVADDCQREQLLLAGEVPVDDRAVDTDRAGDVLDLGLGDAALVEERAGGGEDRRLAGPSACGGRGASCLRHLRTRRGGHDRIVRRLQLRVARV